MNEEASPREERGGAISHSHTCVAFYIQEIKRKVGNQDMETINKSFLPAYESKMKFFYFFVFFDQIFFLNFTTTTLPCQKWKKN